MPSRLVALWCWYHGASFRGYQSQPQGPTVQDTVRDALRAAGFERNPVPAGRTDLGVHARMQVLSLRVVEGVSPEEVAPRLAAHLPPPVGLVLSRPAKPKFHAAWTASGKEYRYRLALGEVPGWAQVSWRIDARPELIAEALAQQVGTRDFISFHDSSSARKPRTVRSATLHELGQGLFEVRLRGDGFARYMVRYLVGSAVGVARGEISPEAHRAALEQAVPLWRIKAPAAGLVLWEVFYPEAMDPFSAGERSAPAGLPAAPPFR